MSVFTILVISVCVVVTLCTIMLIRDPNLNKWSKTAQTRRALLVEPMVAQWGGGGGEHKNNRSSLYKVIEFGSGRADETE